MTVYRPTTFGKHCLLERISVGGMAEVFRARPLDRPEFDRFLVVKRILPHLAEDDEFVRMFVDEAKIAVQLHHRSVCQIYELGRLDGAFFIVMEHIAGKDLLQLQNWLRKRKKIMSVTQACFLAMRICEGLDYAHRKTNDDGAPLRIIHRDISPQNILISFDGEVKVIDFGIARAATTNQKTQVGVLKGKFGYMSPEQVAGDPLDHRSDIFAVGTLLWEMLTARRLFYADSDFATLEKVRSAAVVPPSTRNRRVPPEVDEIVLRALTRDRGERFQWASEMAEALRAFLMSVHPPYEQQRLAAWMRKNFADEVLEEERKEVDFRQFVTQDDVDSYRELHRIDEVIEDIDGDDDEATRVWVVEDPPVTAGVHVVAAADDDPLGLNEQGDDELASVIIGDGALDEGQLSTPFDSSAYMRPDLEGRSFRRRQAARRWGFVLLVLLAVGGAASWVWYQDYISGFGTLVIDAEPRDGVTVLVDGQPVDEPLPIELRKLPAGEVLVELRREEYQSVMEVVAIVGGGAASFVRTLEPAALEATRVELTVSPATAQVFVDGEVMGGMGATRTFNVPTGRTSVVEVYAPGSFVEVLTIDGETDGSFEQPVTLRGLVGDITISSEPPGTVVVDGEEHGTTESPIRLEGLSILETYTLEISPLSRSFRPYRAEIGFDTYYDLRIRPRLPRIGVEADEPPTWGRLSTGAASSGWYRVLVDGRETGLVTPIREERSLPLKSGDRLVTFERPGVRIEVPVTILEGQTVHIEVPARDGTP